MDDIFSLLSKSATGGEYASRGFGFQLAVWLQFIPQWLQYEGFTSCIREAIDDIEAKFWTPEYGFQKERIQVKHQVLTQGTFDDLITVYQNAYRESPASYHWFSIVCTGISAELQPVINGLRRFRDPYPFYADDEAIMSQSYPEFEKRVGDTERAHFIFERVRVIVLSSGLEDLARGIVRTALGDDFGITDNTVLDQSFQRLATLLQSRLNQVVSRMEIETAIGSYAQRNCVTVLTSTSKTPARENQDKALVFNWHQFDGQNLRQYPSPDVWDQEVIGQLRGARDWLRASRGSRCINLHGQRRLSAAVAIGHVFSAVAGFRLVLNYRDQLWSTEDHASPSSPSYEFQEVYLAHKSDRLVVSISTAHQQIQQAVETYVTRQTNQEVCFLHLWGAAPFVAADQVNLAVGLIKTYLTRANSTIGVKHVDLFLAVPSPFALFLGHRLNATMPIQLYEWVGGTDYTPTCYLMP